MTYILFHRISRLHTFAGFQEADGRHPKAEHLRPTMGAQAMLVEVQKQSSRILWTGPENRWSSSLRQQLIGKASLTKVSLGQAEVLPAFVECHTHLLYSGDRKEEFEQRNRGDSYLQIAEAGGGIRSTVKATKKTSDAEHLKQMEARLVEFVQQGVTTVEIKTGYAATVADELRHLKMLVTLRSRALRSKGLPRVVITCLAAHSIPDGESEATWLDQIEKKIFPFAQREGIRVDAFIDRGAFSLARTRQFFAKAINLGISVTAHADQLTRTGASAMGAELNLKSVDHVIEASVDDFAHLAKTSTVAVLLPAADLYTRLPYPKARAMIEAGVRVALATDHNPGSSPGLDLALVGVLARTAMQMTLPEVLCAYTFNAACALGREKSLGHLGIGAEADFICLQRGAQLTDLFYAVGPRRSHKEVKSVWRSGRRIYS